MALFTPQELKLYMRNEILAVDDTIYALATANAIEQVNTYCQRDFTVASAATARSFKVSGTSCILRIDDCTTVTTVVDTSTLAATDYQLQPLNSRTTDGIPVPYEQIERLQTYWTGDSATRLVTVTATWGWLAIPSSVKMAGLIIAKDIVKQRDNNSGVADFGQFGAVRVKVNPIALNSLARFRRVEAFGL